MNSSWYLCHTCRGNSHSQQPDAECHIVSHQLCGPSERAHLIKDPPSHSHTPKMSLNWNSSIRMDVSLETINAYFTLDRKPYPPTLTNNLSQRTCISMPSRETKATKQLRGPWLNDTGGKKQRSSIRGVRGRQKKRGGDSKECCLAPPYLHVD